jgi:hypothetical protein
MGPGSESEQQSKTDGIEGGKGGARRRCRSYQGERSMMELFVESCFLVLVQC